MKRLLLYLALNTAVIIPAQAAIYGTRTWYDPRMQTVTYNPDDVVKVKIKKGTVSLVQVAPGEEVTNVGLGDPLAWKVSVRNNSIFFRPVSTDAPDTNVAVLTDKGRTYALYLVSVNRDPTFVLRYTYPKKPHPVTATAPVIPCHDGNVINGTYQIRGDKSIYPYQIWDDGRFTCMRWQDKQPLPVVYVTDADGKENLVNYSMSANTMVIHQVSGNFILRLGSQVAAVKTSTIVPRAYNSKGTTTRQIREDKPDED